MKTYVVNMEKDTHKRDLITQQLKQHPELDWQIWKAVEGRKLSDEEQAEKILPAFKERYGKSASLPAAGCSLSHNSIYKDIITRNINKALVLEDDAILSENLGIETYDDILDLDSPVAILLTSDFQYMKEDLVKAIYEKHKIYKLYSAFMTSGYLINQKGAELLYRLNTPVQYTADAWQIFIDNGLLLYGVVPHVISFPDGCGEIGLAGNTPLSGWKLLRSKLIKLYLDIMWIVKFVQGHRRSKKIWK